MSNKSSCSSPVVKVGSNDDLLTEILLRLPVRSVLRFKSVSKHYYFLISNPSFRLLHSKRNRNPPSGLLVPDTSSFSLLECELVSFEVNNPVKAPPIKPNLDPDVTRMTIEHSCNGLLLCHANINYYYHGYYIYNPTINQVARLPSFDSYDEAKERGRGLSLAFDPAKSPHYKIVYAYAGESGYKIGIYSSETRTCKPSCTFSVHVPMKMYFDKGVYWNNAIHWLHRMGFVLYFNFDHEIVYKLQTPFEVSYIFESRDQLLLIEILESKDTKFIIHELKSDYSGWCKKYHVDLDEVGGSFTEIIIPTSQSDFSCVVLSVVLGEKEDDSFIVLLIASKVVRLNLVSKTFHMLYDFNLSNGCFNWPYGFQYVESLYSV